MNASTTNAAHASDPKNDLDEFNNAVKKKTIKRKFSNLSEKDVATTIWEVVVEYRKNDKVPITEEQAKNLHAIKYSEALEVYRRLS
ncbi:hypothetical protein [Nonlabens agnitus]|uniref:Uncharacterized protein n=1 Tax=Nonlabens agnitus TaxID=870484 RepID=A0A2S9WXA6_9FLAO|nr:hypothetical protein [Nonlabens agnitus]PRP68110.1 hypothetical protein BST86_13945 [Nonlabens agnitus]